MVKEFKDFIARGNVLELAIGIIIGAAFTGIVNSLVEDIIMPPIGLIIGDMDFSNLFINLSNNNHYETLAAAKESGVATLNYGLFINQLLNFFIISFVIFIIIKQVNKIVPEKEATTKECPFCLSEIPIEATKCSQCTSDIPEISKN